MSRRTSVPLVLAFLCLLAPAAAVAQGASAEGAPAHLSVVDGPAVLEREGRAETAPASMPLLAGDRLRTQAGRVEVLFADGSALHLDAGTVLDFQSDEVVRLLEGQIRLSIAGAARDIQYRIDAPAAWVQVAQPGEYRVSVLSEGDVELAVLRGAAELVNEQGRTFITAGERTFARRGSAPTPAYVFNSAAWTAFDRWSEDRRSERLGASAQYLPDDVRPYARTFDTHGSWRYEQPHGYVWYPRVASGWRPYYRGRWASLRPYGWTWVADDPWGWATHHYGRWGVSAGAWFWIPGRQWGPSWVSWAYATDYVSWCPLGWNDRPVLQIVNVYSGRRYDPWRAWTVVPRRHFGGPYFHVPRAASIHVDARVYNSFVAGDAAPRVQYAVSRSGDPIRSPGRYAVPRSSLTTGNRGEEGRSGAGSARRFPDAARPPRTPSAWPGTGRRDSDARAVARPAPAEESDARSSRSGVSRGDGGLSVARPHTADEAPVRAVPRDPGAYGSAASPPSARETLRTSPRRSDVPDASSGAVPVQRTRPADGVRPVYRAAPRGETAAPQPPRRYEGVPRSPHAAPPQAAPAAPAAPDAPADRRRRSDGLGPSGARAVPRRESAPSHPVPGAHAPGPSMRSAPEAAPSRRAAPAPAAPPPAAERAPERSSGDGAAAGQARRRR